MCCASGSSSDRNVDVYWDDREMCFRFETLYTGKLTKMPKPLARIGRRKTAARTVTSKA